MFLIHSSYFPNFLGRMDIFYPIFLLIPEESKFTLIKDLKISFVFVFALVLAFELELTCN